MLERVAQSAEGGLLERLGRVVLLEFLDGEACGLDRVLGHLDEVAVERHALLGLGSVLDRERTPLRPAVVVGVRERDVAADVAKPSGQHTNAVDQ